MPSEYVAYGNPTSIPIDKRLSSLSVSSKNHENSEFSVNRFSQKFDPYQEFIYRNDELRRRLSSSGEGSADSGSSVTASTSDGSGSVTASGSEGSDSRAESEEVEREERPPLEGQVTEMERQQVETFFKGLKTQIFVSGSLANLYEKTPADEDWQLKYTGIPVVILDVGESRARDRRMIQIALAERGTCFMLWKDIIDNLSSYKVDGPAFHTMRYSKDHTTKVGLSFDTSHHANEMWSHVERLVSCPENISLSTPGKKKKKKEKKSSKPVPLPPKSHISQPCCFQHITSVEREDTDRFFSLKELLPRTVVNSRIHQLDDDE